MSGQCFLTSPLRAGDGERLLQSQHVTKRISQEVKVLSGLRSGLQDTPSHLATRPCLQIKHTFSTELHLMTGEGTLRVSGHEWPVESMQYLEFEIYNLVPFMPRVTFLRAVRDTSPQWKRFASYRDSSLETVDSKAYIQALVPSIQDCPASLE